MMEKPAYFEAVRAKAEALWIQLDGNRELSGPWHLLFRQVQSPQHVLSELLQNADDAGATEASVRIEDGAFVFRHNGEDFTADHFSSLCQFAFSSKRTIRTIGFRGIGFKSTFSLGNTVELLTPTLSVVFDRNRFTEPRWVDAPEIAPPDTRVRVSLRDTTCRIAIEENLRIWSESALSLLFFTNIRSVDIEGRVLRRDSLGPGPVPGSEWMVLDRDLDRRYMVVRSEVVELPFAAQAEIRDERRLVEDDNQALPACRIEIVIGAPGRLFVVLPTDVRPDIPFACNAPFVQTPDRASLKAPETSPTNRFLLDYVGQLAANTMLGWLGRASESVDSRSGAYSLMPDGEARDESVAGSCARTITNGFNRVIEDQPILLTTAGDVVGPKQCVSYPEKLYEVWPEDQLIALFDDRGRPAFSRFVDAGNRRKLVRMSLIDEIKAPAVVGALCSKRPPKPESWGALMTLWTYVTTEVSGQGVEKRRQVALSPVNGKDQLYGAAELVRLGEKRLLQSESDWEFLSEHLLVLDQRWTNWLADQARNAEQRNDATMRREVFQAQTLLKDIGLELPSDMGLMLDFVASKVLISGVTMDTAVRLAQIAAKLGATAGPSFRYVTEDNFLRSTDSDILFDQDGFLSESLPDGWRKAHVLHGAYSDAYTSCAKAEWEAWVTSGRAKLHRVPTLKTQEKNPFRTRAQFESTLRAIAGALIKLGYPYSIDRDYHYQRYYLHDTDFPAEIVQHWTSAGEPDAARITLELMLRWPPSQWPQKQTVTGEQTSSTGGQIRRQVQMDPNVPATWLRRFMELTCLPDTRGQYRKPSELLMRTRETEAHVETELFVDFRFDNETARPLLKALGVRDTAPGPDRLIERLRTLACSATPPVGEVDKLYRALDTHLERCSTADAERVKAVFQGEKVMLTEAHGWATSANVFQFASGEDIPGAAVIRATVRDLALWSKVGVAPRPTIELAIKWLNSLPTGVRLSTDDMRRVRALLAPYRLRIWNECRRWLNLAGEWAPVDGLRYSIGMNTLTKWTHLHDWVIQQTADLKDLSSDTGRTYPFAGLSPLSERIEYQFQRGAMALTPLRVDAWMQRFGFEARRIVLEDAAEMGRIRAVAADLAETRVAVLPVLELLPSVDGRPAGTAVAVSAVWMDHILYIDGSSKARLAKHVPDQIGARFDHSRIKEALIYCYERSPEDVSAYLEENFDLAPPSIVPQGQAPEADDDEQMGKVMSDASDLGLDELPEDAAADGQQHELFDTPDGHARRRAAGEAAAAGPSPAASLLSRYARSQGFLRVAGDFYRHPDGSRIVRRGQSVFAWQRLDPRGETIFYFRVTPHCLTCEPLEVNAEVWDLLAKFPNDHGLLLFDPEGRPILYAGAHLVAMRDSRTVTLHPAAYRLVYNNPSAQ